MTPSATCVAGLLFLCEGVNLAQIAILIDGSNFLGQLDDCDLGYPALFPLIESIRGANDLVYARFYSAPPIHEPYKAKWLSFRAANRHVPGLDFFLGYRNVAGNEKAIDVALAVDLIYGCAHNHFEKVAVVGGDGDHLYAFKIAKSMRKSIRVFLMPMQQPSDLLAAKIQFTRWEVRDLLAFCDRGKQAGVPLHGKAPAGHPDLTPQLKGPLAKPV